MSYSELLSITSSMGGRFQIVKTGDAKVPMQKTLPAGVAGVVDSVVETTTIIDGLPAGHGITSSDVVGVFWEGGMRVGLTVTAYDADSITVTTASGTGDALPSVAETAVIVSVRVVEDDVSYNGAAATLLSIVCAQRCGVEMLDDQDASILAAPIPIPAKAANSEAAGYLWSEETAANPMSGVAASTEFYNGSEVAAVVYFGILIS